MTACFTEWMLVVMLAVLLDLLVGDPHYPLHPVRLMGGLIARLEQLFRRRRNPSPAYLRGAGIATVLLTVGISAAAAAGLLALANAAGRLPALLCSVFLVYSCIAIRDLRVAAERVRRALLANDLPAARAQLALIVGRDTRTLGRRGVVRAAVETVAEGTCDGIIAPLCFAALGGPVLAIAYRAINTLDSLIGHKEEPYLHFGWCAARLDDAANYLPARLAALLLAGATLFESRGRYCRSPRQALATAGRDAGRHASPNAGWPEAAVAGALGVQLGGTSYYDGQPHCQPALGEPFRPPEADDIARASRLMAGAALGFCALLALPFIILWYNDFVGITGI